MIQKYINPIWLTENITADMTIEDVKTVIDAAPRVEIDTDLLHSITTKRSARENKVMWAFGIACRMVEAHDIKDGEVLMNLFYSLMGDGEQ